MSRKIFAELNHFLPLNVQVSAHTGQVYQQSNAYLYGLKLNYKTPISRTIKFTEKYFLPGS